MPMRRVISRTSASIRDRGTHGPNSPPEVGSVSRYLVEASFTVFRFISAEVPPITMDR